MRDIYLKNKSYLAIYSGLLGDSFATALFSFFSGTYLYSLGLPLHWVLLFFGLEFGLRGFLSPLGVLLASRVGAARTILISYLSLGLFFFTLSFSVHSLAVGFFSFIFMSLSRGLYFPCKSLINSQVVDNRYRGEELSFEMVISTVGHLVGIGVGALLVGIVPYYWVAILATVVTIVLSLPYLLYLPNIKPIVLSYSEAFIYMFSRSFRPNLVPLIGESFSIIAYFSLIPLLIYIIAGNFRLFGAVLGASVLLNIIITLLFGYYVDKVGNKKAVHISAVTIIAAYTTFIFIKTPIGALVAQSAALVGLSMFKSGWETAIHKKIFADGAPALFAAAKEMTLCFSELFILSLYALTAYYFPDSIFTIGLLLGACGLIVAIRNFRFI